MPHPLSYYASSPIAQSLEEFAGSYLQNWSDSTFSAFVSVLETSLSVGGDADLTQLDSRIRSALKIAPNPTLKYSLDLMEGCDRSVASAILAGAKSIARDKGDF